MIRLRIVRTSSSVLILMDEDVTVAEVSGFLVEVELRTLRGCPSAATSLRTDRVAMRRLGSQQ